jgi:hypothetical protein
VERWSLTATSEHVADQVTVQPGDPVVTAEAEDWLKDYANGRDAALREGLIAAVDRYDSSKGPSFVPFAVASVVGELKRHLRDTSWRLHVPRPGVEP